ncbi:UNVERIFIED_CONTAM: hypothetical protein ABIC26_000485 [Paenibacillus sp. PvR008]
MGNHHSDRTVAPYGLVEVRIELYIEAIKID